VAKVERAFVSLSGLSVAAEVYPDLADAAMVAVVSWVEGAGATNFSSAVTWNSVGLTLLESRTQIYDATYRKRVEIWGLASPSAIATSLVISRGGSGSMQPLVAVYILSDVNQSTPFGSTGNQGSSVPSAADIVFSLAGAVAGDLVIGGISPNNLLDTVPGQTNPLNWSTFGAGDRMNYSQALIMARSSSDFAAAAVVVKGAGRHIQPVYVASSYGMSTTGVGVSVTKPAGTQDGDVGFLFVFAGSAAAVLSGGLSGWEVRGSLASGGFYGAVLCKEFSGEPSSWVFTLAASSKHSYILRVYRNAREYLSAVPTLSSVSALTSSVPAPVYPTTKFYNDRMLSFIGLQVAEANGFSILSSLGQNGDYKTDVFAPSQAVAVVDWPMAAVSVSPMVGGLPLWNVFRNPPSLYTGIQAVLSFAAKEQLSDAVFEAGAVSSGLIGYTVAGPAFLKTFTDFPPGDEPSAGYSLDVAKDRLAVAEGGTSAPFLRAWAWQNGWGKRYADQATPVGSTVLGVKFSPDGLVIVCGSTLSPYLHAYVWSGRAGGFGTKYANPSPLPDSVVYDVAWAPSGNAVALATQGTPWLRAYRWAGGFGPAYSAPGVPPLGGIQKMAFSPNGNFVAVSIATSPGIEVYRWNDVTGFTVKMPSPPSPVPNAYGVAWAPGQDYITVTSNANSPYTFTFHWSDASGFGALVVAPSLGGAPISARGAGWHPNGTVVAVGAAGSKRIQLFPFSGGAFGAAAADPRAFTITGEAIAWLLGDRTSVLRSGVLLAEASGRSSSAAAVPVEFGLGGTLSVGRTAVVSVEAKRRLSAAGGSQVEWSLNLHMSDQAAGRERDLAFNSVLRRTP
jgi:hypothetical protein